MAGANTTVTGAGSTGNPYVISAAAGAAAVTAGCGLTGTGTAADPITANTQTWPYTCPVTEGGGAYCDPATGELRTDPPVRQDFFEISRNDVLPSPIPVPTTPEENIDSISLTITNPDACRPAHVILFREVDLDLNLPANGGAGMIGLDSDDMVYLANQGNAMVFNTHAQENKISNLTLTPGETRTITMQIQAGRGAGGAVITRIQATLRAWIFTNLIG
jgi:hypothetical protein